MKIKYLKNFAVVLGLASLVLACLPQMPVKADYGEEFDYSIEVKHVVDECCGIDAMRGMVLGNIEHVFQVSSTDSDKQKALKKATLSLKPYALYEDTTQIIATSDSTKFKVIFTGERYQISAVVDGQLSGPTSGPVLDKIFASVPADPVIIKQGKSTTLKSFKVKQYDAENLKGKTLTIKDNITWNEMDNDFVKVTADGKVTGKKAGLVNGISTSVELDGESVYYDCSALIVGKTKVKAGKTYNVKKKEQQVYTFKPSAGKYSFSVTGDNAFISIYDSKGKLVSYTEMKTFDSVDTYTYKLSKKTYYVLVQNYSDATVKLKVKK